MKKIFQIVICLIIFTIVQYIPDLLFDKSKYNFYNTLGFPYTFYENYSITDDGCGLGVDIFEIGKLLLNIIIFGIIIIIVIKSKKLIFKFK